MKLVNLLNQLFWYENTYNFFKLKLNKGLQYYWIDDPDYEGKIPEDKNSWLISGVYKIKNEIN